MEILFIKSLSEVITKEDVHKVTERYFQQGEIEPRRKRAIAGKNS